MMKAKQLLSEVAFLLTLTLLLPAFTFAQGTWAQKADFPGLARYSASGFSIGTKIYIGIGFNDGDWSMSDFWEWDQPTNLWTQKSNFPGRISGSVVGFSIGVKGYILIGDDNNTDSTAREFWEYNPVTDSWTRKAYLSGDPRDNAAGFAIENKGYIGTGSFWNSGLNNLVLYKDFWEYNQATDTWTRKADFGGGARSGAVGFSIGNKGYFGMGANASDLLKDFWEYDQETNVWTRKADFGGLARSGAISFSLEKSGYIGTGYNNGLHNDFWEWDQTTNVWTQKTTFGGIARSYAVGFSIGNKGYVGTGGTGVNPNYALQDLWEFDPSAITGLKEVVYENNFFYPNPSSDFITLNTSHAGNSDLTLNFYNATGKLIRSELLKQNQLQINVADLKNGIYMVEVKSNTWSKNQKLIIQR